MNSQQSVSTKFATSPPSDGVNPFLLYNTNLTMYEWYVNNMRIVNDRTNYAKNMTLTSSIDGMVVQ